MCSGNLKSKCLRKLLEETDDKMKNKLIVKVRDMKLTKPSVFPKFSTLEKTLQSKLQKRTTRKKNTDSTISVSFKMKLPAEELEAMYTKTKEHIFEEKDRKVKQQTIEIRSVEKPLLYKLQLKIMHEKINKKLEERERKKFKRELDKEYYGILPSQGLKLRMRKIL